MCVRATAHSVLRWMVLTILMSVWRNCHGSGPGLLPYGEDAGDQLRNCRSRNAWTRLDISIPVFGKRAFQLVLQEHGLIAFSGYPRCPPCCHAYCRLEDMSRYAVVAPFYQPEIEERRLTYYREAIDSATLAAAQRIVDEHATAHRGFQVEMVFVATWQFQKNLSSVYQCVLMTDGRRTLAAYLYTGTMYRTGRGRWGAACCPWPEIGFASGDGAVFEDINESGTPAVLNAPSLSNVGVPGLFIFPLYDSRLWDSTECFEGSAGALSVSPLYDAPYGGALLIVNVGQNCLRVDQDLACVFSIQEYMEVIPAVFVDSRNLRCVAPPSGRFGRAVLGLSVDGGATIARNTSFYFLSKLRSQTELMIDGKYSDDVAETIGWNGDNQTLKLTWTLAGKSDLLDVWAMCSNPDGEMKTFLPIKVGVFNTGYVEVSGAEVRSMASTVEDTPWIALRLLLAPSLEVDGEAFFRALAEEGQSYFPTRPFLVLPRETADNLWGSVREDITHFWESFLEYDFNHLPPVPCTEDVAALDPDWSVDVHCPSADKCPAHPGSSICYRQTFANLDGSSHQVCYLGDGSMNMDPLGAGTADRVHTPTDWASLTGAWAQLKHFWWDGLPYFILKAIGELDTYRKLRPNPSPDDCFEDPPVLAQAMGDPHITTLDGLLYTFNGAGEFWLLRVDGGELDVQVRMEKFQGKGGTAPAATVITSIVLKTNRSQTVQIGLSNLSTATLEVMANGEVQVFDDVLDTHEFSGGIIVSMPASAMQPTASVVIHGMLSLDITAASGALAVVARGNPSLWNRTTGLLGVFDNQQENDLKSQSGMVLPPDATASQIHHDFGLSWILKRAEDSFFTYQNAQSFEGLRKLDFEPMLVDMMDFDGHPANALELATCGANYQCLFDFRVTGSVGFANATMARVEEFKHVIEVTQEVKRAASTRRNTSIGTSSPDIVEYHASNSKGATSLDVFISAAIALRFLFLS